MRRTGTAMAWTLGAAALAVMIPAAAAAPVKTATYTFDYAYPAAAARYPALKRWLEADRAAARTRIATDADAGRREARKGGFPFHAYESDTTWQVVTETPRFLSLSGEHYQFTGGAHGMTVSNTLLWDKAAGRRLVPRDLFTSPAAIQRALGAPYCRALDAERAKKRAGEDLGGGGDDPFNQCVAVKDTTLLLGSTDRRRLDRVGLIADAYVAGPYAEGAYEVTLPVTPALLAAVKPAYRGTFAVR